MRYSPHRDIDTYARCAKIKEHFMKGLTELVQSGVSWKLKRVNDQFDVDVDHTSRGYKVGILVGQTKVAQIEFDEEIPVGVLVQKNLGIVAAIYQAEIEKWCPNSVESVLAERHTAGLNFPNDPPAIRLTIKFKNGHFFEVWEHEAETDEFKAQCVMLYDLPNL